MGILYCLTYAWLIHRWGPGLNHSTNGYLIFLA